MNHKILITSAIFFFLLSFNRVSLSYGETKILQTATFKLDRLYTSMLGPYHQHNGIQLLDVQPPELLWVQGYKAEILGEDGRTAKSREFICHSTMSMHTSQDFKDHKRIFNAPYLRMGRYFTIAQGQYEVNFPEGMGMPLVSNEKLTISSQFLNLNQDNKVHKVRQKISIDFVRDREVVNNMTPLIMLYAFGHVLVGGQANASPDKELHGPGCLIAESALTTRVQLFKDRYGNQFSQHWIVPPGRQVNHVPVTQQLGVPFDTTIHYIVVHVHPFAESVELKDLTTGETVFKSFAKNSKNRIKLEHIDHFSDKEGIPIYKDHEYELISIYNNTTSQNQDAMALMFVYVQDKNFQKPKLLSFGDQNKEKAIKRKKKREKEKSG